MRTTIFCYLLLFSVKGQLLRFVDDTPEILKDSLTVTNDWEHLENLLKNLVKSGMKSLMPSVTDGMNNINISSSCFRDTIQLIGGIQKLKTWAIRFLDSTAKSVDGLLSGTFFAFGSYDECIDTVAYNQRSGKNKGEVMFTGKYCTLRIKPSLPKLKRPLKEGEILEELEGFHKKGTILSEMAEFAPVLYSFAYRVGLCIPSGCSEDDVNKMLEPVSNYTRLFMNVNRCEVKEKPNFSTMRIFAMSLYSLAGLLVLLGTLTDTYCYFSKVKPTNTFVRVMLAFSFISNFGKLFNTSTASTSLSCLNGIRFLTMAWIILEHSYLLVLTQVVSGLIYVRPLLRDFAFQVVVLPSVSVDTFFFLGGFLVCYITTKYVKIRKGNLNIAIYIFHRLWRILPALSFIVLYVYIMEMTASGPIANYTFKPFIEGCTNNWWATLTFINNFYDASNLCLPHTWYLAMDMQLYIAALFILIPLFRWPKLGIALALGALALSIVASGIVVYVKNIPPALIINDVNPQKWSAFLTEFYYKPYPHIGPYIIGMLSAYYFAMTPDIKIPQRIQWIGWFCATVFTTSALYGTFEWNGGRDPTILETIFYASFHRIGWALSMAWIVICCGTGHAGVVNHILSWKVWIPLGRLTYMAYLVHFIVLITFVASFRNSLAPVHSVGVWLFFGHLMVTYGVGFAGAMLIESPLMALEKLILPQQSTKDLNENTKENNHAVEDLQREKRQKNETNETFSCETVENGTSVCRL